MVFLRSISRLSARRCSDIASCMIRSGGQKIFRAVMVLGGRPAVLARLVWNGSSLASARPLPSVGWLRRAGPVTEVFRSSAGWASSRAQMARSSSAAVALLIFQAVSNVQRSWLQFGGLCPSWIRASAAAFTATARWGDLPQSFLVVGGQPGRAIGSRVETAGIRPWPS